MARTGLDDMAEREAQGKEVGLVLGQSGMERKVCSFVQVLHCLPSLPFLTNHCLRYC